MPLRPSLVVSAIGCASVILNGCHSSKWVPTGLQGDVQLGVNAQAGAFIGDALILADGALPPARPSPSLDMFRAIAFNSKELKNNYQRSFGLEIAGAAESGLFSGSFGFKKDREAVNEDSTVTISGKVFARMQNKVVDVPSSWFMNTTTSQVSLDLKRLPMSSNETNLRHFVDFFNRYGTHRLKRLFLGGTMRMEFKSRIVKSSTSSSIKSSFSLGAAGKLLEKIGMDGSSVDVTWSRSDIETFETHSTSASYEFHTVGGDNTKMTWDDWKDTVEGSEAAIDFEYRPWDDVVDEVARGEGWDYDKADELKYALAGALESYLLACPNACSSHGFCDFRTKSCTCDDTYKGDDCSQRTCPEDCGEWGTCDDSTHGTCKCAANVPVLERRDDRAPCQENCDKEFTFPGTPEDSHPCKAHAFDPHALKHPTKDFSDGQQKYACIPLGANGRGDDPHVAANLYCQALVDQGKLGGGEWEAVAYKSSNPVCDYDFWDAQWCTAWRLGNGHVVNIDHPEETHPGMPRHEDIFASVTCKPKCGRGAWRGNSTTNALPSLVPFQV